MGSLGVRRALAPSTVVLVMLLGGAPAAGLDLGAPAPSAPAWDNVLPLPARAERAADAEAAQPPAGGPDETRVEEGFSNVQIVWTNLAFGSPTAADEADATGDGHPELAIGTESGVLFADKHFATIHWETKLFDPVNVVSFQDLDGAGFLDVVAVTRSGRALGLNGDDGSILWETGVGSLQGAHLADVNGDGAKDLLLAAVGGSVSALDARTGARLWEASIADAAQFAVNRIRSRGLLASAVGDVTGDGVPDLVVGDRTHMGGIGVPSSSFATVYGFDGATGRLLFHANLHGAEPGAYVVIRSLALGDVNGDGAPDVVVGGHYDNGILKNYAGYCNAFVCVPTTLPPEAPRFKGGFVDALDLTAALGGESAAHRGAVVPLWSWDLNRARVTAVGFAGTTVLAGTTFGDVVAVADGEATGNALNVSHEEHPAAIHAIRSLPHGDALVLTDYFFVRVGPGPTMKAVFDPPGRFAPLAVTVVGEEESLLAAVADARVYHLTPDFRVEATTATRGKASTLAWGEFTGDAIPDLVVGGDDGEVSLLHGRTGRTLLNGTTPASLVGDLGVTRVNGDTKPDVLAVSADGTAQALDGRTFAPLWRVALGDDALAVRTGDLTRDGVADLAVVLLGGTVAVRSGRDGTEAWTYAPGPDARATALALGDFDGDGDLDVAVGHDRDGVILVRDGATGGALWSAPAGQPVKALEGADLNGDRRAEVVAVLNRPSGSGNPAVVAYDRGAALWKLSVAEAGFLRTIGLATGRIDATSKGADVLVCLSAHGPIQPGRRATAELPPPVHVAFGIHGEQGHVFWRARLPEACGPVALGDLNGDRWSEALLSYGAGIAALHGQTGELVMNYRTNGRNRDLAALRLNGDSVPEVMLASEDANVYALAFSENALFGDDERPAGPVAADDFFGPARKSKRGVPGFDTVALAAVGLALLAARRRREP